MKRCSRIKLLLRIGLVAIGALAGQAAAEHGASGGEQRQLNLESFDHVWATVRDKHWDPTLGGVDWKAIRDELRPRMEQTSSKEEGRAILTDMLGRLGQSHFVIYPGEFFPETGSTGFYGPRDTGCGFEVCVTEGRAVVSDVRKGSPAARQGIEPGWEIRQIGAEAPVEHWPHIAAVTSRLLGVVDNQVQIAFLDDEKHETQVTLDLPKRRSRLHNCGNLPPMRVWIEHDWLEDDIGYIAFNYFFDPLLVMPQFNHAMETFLNARGIIIDVRGNGGGIGTMGAAIAGWLIEEQGKYLGTSRMRDAEAREYVYPRARVYAGPVAVLIDRRCGSNTECFAAGLQDLGRARLFGTRTMGAVLPVALDVLPTGDRFQYAIANYVSAAGHELEGRGVIPDVTISSRPGASPGQDAVVRAAVAWINQQGAR